MRRGEVWTLRDGGYASKARLGECIGVLADEDMESVGRGLARILGLG